MDCIATVQHDRTPPGVWTVEVFFGWEAPGECGNETWGTPDFRQVENPLIFHAKDSSWFSPMCFVWYKLPVQTLLTSS